MFPGAGPGFLAGLRGALAGAGVAHEIVPEAVGVCADTNLVSDRIQNLLLKQAPDVVTGIMGSGVLREVHAHFSGAETPFIVNDLGGDPLMTGGARNPFVFGNTLNLWRSMYALREDCCCATAPNRQARTLCRTPTCWWSRRISWEAQSGSVLFW